MMTKTLAIIVLLSITWTVSVDSNRIRRNDWTWGRSAQKKSPIEDCGMDMGKFLILNKICDDCFSLYKEQDVYSLCRSDCFGTHYFSGCMETLLVKDELKMKVASYLDDVQSNGYASSDRM